MRWGVRGRYGALLAVAAVAVLYISSAQATPPTVLDTSFGSGGTVTTSFSSGADGAKAVVLQPDGKIVAVGDSGTQGDFALARYNPDGTLDASFGSGGKVTTSVALGAEVSNAVALQPDGKIVVAGTSDTSPNNRDFALARYNANGSLDTTFGSGGIVTTDVLGHDDIVNALALQSDGKIVAAGQANTGSAWDFALVRYNANGTLDTSFGTNGKVTTSFGSGDSVCGGLVLQPDGKLVLVGYAGTSTVSDFALARYNPDGSLDSTFGTSGMVTTAVGSTQNWAYAAALQPDGKIVVAGGDVGSVFSIILARYDSNGTLDPSFGASGIAEGDEGIASAVAIQPDGRIVTAGQLIDPNGGNEFGLTRFDANGEPDLSFGTDGDGGETTSFGGGNSTAFAVALQPNGEIVAAGTTQKSGTDYDFALARYLGSTLAVTKSGDGSGIVRSSPTGIQCGPTCAAAFPPVAVTLTAHPSARSTFAGWSGDCTGTGPCTVTESSDHSVNAEFTADCVAPKVTGKNLQAAKRAIRRSHCSVGRVGRSWSQKVAKGRVISQRPAPGKKLAPRSKIALTVSRGRRSGRSSKR